MNPNIGLERKTGPVTPEGKAVSRFNALKTGEYSKLLQELECKYCKQKDCCILFRDGGKCTLRREIVKSIFVDHEQYNIFLEATELYKICLAKGLEELYFNTATADRWIGLASKQLDRLMGTATTGFARLNLERARDALWDARCRKAQEEERQEKLREARWVKQDQEKALFESTHTKEEIEAKRKAEELELNQKLDQMTQELKENHVEEDNSFWVEIPDGR